MQTDKDLQTILARIDGRGYKAYKDLAGSFGYAHFTLFIDHVQGDPFAAPSKIRVRIPSTVAKIPPDLFSTTIRRMAFQDFLIRMVDQAIRGICRGHRGIGKSGLVSIDVGGQEVLERTAMVVTSEWIEARMQIGLPAQGRTILGRQAETMFCHELPQVVTTGMTWTALDPQQANDFVNCVENQEAIRAQLDSQGLIAFVADGSLLPRESGASDLPLTGMRAQPFFSQESLRVTIPIPHEIVQHNRPTRALTGLGIPTGITLIVGGGYHGKSTLLRALERGVYPHVPGDGREYVVTVPTAVKVRAEDGRRIEDVNISGFITNLPFNQNTTRFSTENASGSTSQAATILEALEVEAKALFLDEDTSATNFMVRDARMQALVHKHHEPITPFVDRIRELYEKFGVSTILVMGGCGDYFDVADTVIMMQGFQPKDVTADAHQIATKQKTQRQREVMLPFPSSRSRMVHKESIDPSSGRQGAKIDAKALNVLLFGRDVIDLSGVEQLVDKSQTRAVGHAILLVSRKIHGAHVRLADALAWLDEVFSHDGLDTLDPFYQPNRHPGNFARPRSYEIAATINRLRSIQLRQS